MRAIVATKTCVVGLSHRAFGKGYCIRSFSQWSNVTLAPPDKILGLNEAFKADKSPFKVNLGVGAYRSDMGIPFVPTCVMEAEKRIVQRGDNHEYLPIGGSPEFINVALHFAYGQNSKVLNEQRVAGVQTLSGTGACRVAGEFFASHFGRGTKIYISNPSWGNHFNIMRNAGLTPVSYRYFNPATCELDFNGLMEDIDKAEQNAIFLFHACAHNPTGCDPTMEQWKAISDASKRKNITLFFDCAYQGFASGDSDRDAAALRYFVDQGHHVVLAQSFAKNFGLYGERVGALSVVTESPDVKARVESQLKTVIRPMYSNPPLFGARIVTEILQDHKLSALWKLECYTMATRIKEMRELLVKELKSCGSTRDWSHISDQIGMFAFTGLSSSHVNELVNTHHIYCTEDGRISIAGINVKNAQYVANAIHQVTK